MEVRDEDEGIDYDNTGHMAATIMPDRPRPSWVGRDPTPDEAKSAILGFTAYFATYTVDERAGIVTHHRIGMINRGAGPDVQRRFTFQGADRVVLTPVDAPGDEATWSASSSRPLEGVLVSVDSW